MSWPLRRAASLYADSIAVVWGAREITYAQLAERVGALGAALGELRVQPGSRVGFLGVNSLAHLECWLGVPAFGRVLVDLNFRLAEEELAFIIDDCELDVLFVDEAQLPVAMALRERCSSLRELILDAHSDFAQAPACGVVSYEQLLAREPAAAPDLDAHTLAAISYTGGTTGRPKGVMLSHENLLANARHNLIATGHRPSDRWLHVCPMFHVAGTANVLAATWVGARQIIAPRFEPAAVAELIERHQITHLVLVPTMLAMLLERCGERRPLFSSLRHLQYAASPISPELQRRVLEALDCDVVQFYGMTEAAPTVSCLSASDHRRGLVGSTEQARRLRSIGHPVVGVEVEVRDGDGRRLAAGEVGELWVRGPNVMLGYWRRPQANEQALAGGWYRTGDAAYADDQGYLYLVDRLKDMIITGGENVYCIEVESALAEHPAVREVAVFGVPDARWGEAVHAVVVAAAPVDEQQLISHLRARIAGYKVPRRIELRSEPLPKSGAGKVLKHLLREPHWAGRERRIG